MILIVTYDLHDPGRDYEDVIAELDTADTWAHPQGSVWLLDTTLTVSDWVDKLAAAGDSNDEYFVARLVTHDWAAMSMDSEVVDWLESPDRNW